MIDFTRVNGIKHVYNAHSLFENAPMIDFTRVNGISNILLSRFSAARQPRHHRSELGKIVFKIFGGQKFGVGVGVVVEPSTNRKAKGIRYSCCGASPAFAQTQPSPLLWLRLCCLVITGFCKIL